jgi:hypothetical protein
MSTADRADLTGQALAAEMHKRPDGGPAVHVSPVRRARLRTMLGAHDYLSREDWRDVARCLAEDLRLAQQNGGDIVALRQAWKAVKAALYQGDSDEVVAFMEMDGLLAVSDTDEPVEPYPGAPHDPRIPWDYEALSRAYARALRDDAEGRQPSNDAPMDEWFAYVLHLGFSAAIARSKQLIDVAAELGGTLEGYAWNDRQESGARMVGLIERLRTVLKTIGTPDTAAAVTRGTTLREVAERLDAALSKQASLHTEVVKARAELRAVLKGTTTPSSAGMRGGSDFAAPGDKGARRNERLVEAALDLFDDAWLNKQIADPINRQHHSRYPVDAAKLWAVVEALPVALPVAPFTNTPTFKDSRQVSDHPFEPGPIYSNRCSFKYPPIDDSDFMLCGLLESQHVADRTTPEPSTGGFVDPILIDEDLLVLSGVLRVAALKKIEPHARVLTQVVLPGGSRPAVHRDVSELRLPEQSEPVSSVRRSRRRADRGETSPELMRTFKHLLPADDLDAHGYTRDNRCGYCGNAMGTGHVVGCQNPHLPR